MCKHIKADGTQCKAHSMNGTDYCYLHNPEISVEEKREQQSKGGKNTTLGLVAEPLPPIEFQKPNDVVTLLTETINQVRAGKMDVKVANSLSILSGQLLKAFEVSQLNEKVEIMERVILEKKTTY